MITSKWVWAAVLSAVLCLPAAQSLAICLDVPGDVDNDGDTDVADSLCTLLLTLWETAGGSVPTCANDEPERGDADCSGVVTVADVQTMTRFALGFDLPPALDVNNDKCLDSCDVCGNPPQPDGASCDDGNPCTLLDTCQQGACFGGVPKPCTALSDCHDPGECNPADGVCSNPLKADGSICDDGNPCTQTDTCSNGVCVGSNPVICPDLDSCNVGVCNATTGACGIAPQVDGTTCDDGNACTQSDTCAGGVCIGSDFVTCSASGPCSSVGICNPGTGVCSDPPAPNGTGCDDGNECTQIDVCLAGNCTGLNPVVCADNGPCEDSGICNPLDGECAYPVKADGASCDDGDECTQTDTCISGSCTGLNPVVCTAADQCKLAGVCDSGTGDCSDPNRPDGTPCDDGDACTIGDSCQAGLCVGGAPKNCPAPNSCSVGQCDSGTGECSITLKSDGDLCDDGDACTQIDTCQGSVCVGADPVVCEAADDCKVVGLCVPATGECTTPSAPNGTACDDGNACTLDDECLFGTCVPQDVVTCSAIGPCFDIGTCNQATGICSNPQKLNGTLCDDGNACTLSDVCQSGICQGLNPVTCSAQGQCFGVGTCNETTGLCSNPVLPDGTVCEDGDFGTCPDACQAGTCISGPQFSCDDGNACTDDACVLGVCEYTPNTEPCGIPSLCLDGSCQFGLCLADPDPCNDNNPCTDDFCDGDGSCINAANTQLCDDGNLCTENDICAAGTCIGLPKTCGGADSQCTAGVCDPASGLCTSTAEDGTDCDDGVACTVNDICDAGVCEGELFAACADPNSGLLCAISGTAGDIVECPIRVVRTKDASAPATSLQMGLSYDPKIRVDFFSDGELCFGPACFEYTIPTPNPGLQSGHTLVTGSDISGWDGNGEFLFVNLGDPSEELSDAYFEGALIQGSELVVTAHFEVLEDIPGDEPVVVTVEEVAASDEFADPIQARMFDFRVITCSEGAICDALVCDPVDPNSCDDGNPCTQDTCVGGVGCDYQELTGACEDGDLCTSNDVCVNGTCVGEPTICEEDGNPCTIALCNPGTGLCGVPSLSGTPCDDEDPCTFPDECSAGLCTAPVYPGCENPSERVLCILDGDAGDTVTCSLRVARDAQASLAATGLSLTIEFPAGIELINLEDGEFCPVPNICIPWTIPDIFPSVQAGHSVVFAPESLGDWTTSGGMLLVNLVDPTIPLSDAYLFGGSVVGDDIVVDLNFQLNLPFPADSPAIVRATELSASDEDAEGLTTTTTNLLTVTSP